METKNWITIKIAFVFFFFFNAYAEKKLVIHFFTNGLKDKLPAYCTLPSIDTSPEMIEEHYKECLRKNNNFLRMDIKVLSDSEDEINVNIHVQQKLIIKSIVIKGLKKFDIYEVTRYLKNQKNEAIQEEFLDADKQAIETFLFKKGYTNAKVNNVYMDSSSLKSISLIFEIEQGKPCRIDDIKILGDDADSFEKLNFGVNSYQICDISQIEDSIDNYKIGLMNEGYLTPELEIKELTYTLDKEGARVYLSFKRGLNTSIEIIEEDKSELIPSQVKLGKDISFQDMVWLNDEEIGNQIIEAYKKKGYNKALISSFQSKTINKKNKFLQYKVKKGNRFYVNSFVFQHTSSFTDKELLNAIGLPPYVNNLLFVESEIEVYQEKLKNYFLEKGYQDVIVNPAEVSFSLNQNLVNIIFKINIKNIYLLNDVIILGKPEKLDTNKEILRKHFFIGTPVSEIQRKKYTEEIKRELLNAGYYYSEVRTSLFSRASENDVNLTTLQVEISSGPKVVIKSIDASGDLLEKKSRLILLSGLSPGDDFTFDNLETARLRLIKTNLFSSVIIEPLDPEAIERRETEIDVLIRTTERKGYSLSVSPGFSTFKGYIFETDFTLSKLTKEGLIFNANASISQDIQQKSFSNSPEQVLGRQITLGLMEPLLKIYTWESPFDAGILGSWQVVSEPLTSRFYESYQAKLDWRNYVWKSEWVLSFALMHEDSKTLGAESVPLEVLDKSWINIKEASVRLTIDNRDEIAWPTKGHYLFADYKNGNFNLGSHVQFKRYQGELNFFIPIFRSLSTAFSLGLVDIEDVAYKDGNGIVPPSSRRAYFNDDVLIRGFGDQTLGPLLWVHYPSQSSTSCRTSLAVTGATRLAYSKTELRYRFVENFGGSLFLDMGQSSMSSKETQKIQSSLLKYNSSVTPSVVKTGTAFDLDCVPDSAYLVPGNELSFSHFSLKKFIQESYSSVGFSLRFIVPNFATISVDYGYPLRDGTETLDGCVTVSEANSLDANTPPKCVKRRQSTVWLDRPWLKISFPGTVHLRISSKF